MSSRRFEARFPGFRLRAAPALWVFLVALPLLGVAALNTGNNALYLLVALLLGTFAASGVLSRYCLRNLRVELRPAGDVFASSPVRLLLQVENRSTWLPAAGVMCRLAGMPGQALVPPVPPNDQRTLTIATMFPRRGQHRLPAVQVEVRLPLGFFVKTVRWPQERQILIFPRRVTGGVPRWADLSRREALLRRGRSEPGGDVEQLREFHTGDDRRDIHWKQTARQQRLIVVERRQRKTSPRYLVLDRQLPRRNDALLAEHFEALVSEVASAALAELQLGREVGLIVGSTVTPPASGPAQTRRLLTLLALTKAVGPGEDPLPSAVQGDGVYRLVEARR
ncbi:MAG: DUF58 domain-containing protein [Thermoanaerobaculaceae bacterium]|nr:DUF58 domain-containing protein [Thermoanaerobaculaceae bacterium]MDI9622612.1 DUF58 domain-containing protein [Acidobacteriota bacterium]HPW54639.1 DUF58 domain-containing protein [Thermoanaerobaculaceae bacterium]